MGLVNSTNHIIPITRNQTILVSKTGVLYESLASVYSIDIPRLKNDGNDVGVLRGDVTGLFNRMITIPLTNDEDMSADIVQDNNPSQSPSISTFIYLDDLKVVRNYDSTIVPVFPRKNLYDYMMDTGHILTSIATSTYSQKKHNHKGSTESEKDYRGTFITSVKYDESTKKLIFYDGNSSVKSSIQMTDYMAPGTHPHYYVTSIKYDNTTSKLSYQSSGTWTALDTVLSNVLAKSGHNHNYITSFGDYDTTNNKLTFNCADGTSISSDALTNALATSTHSHNYVTGIKYDNTTSKLSYQSSGTWTALDTVLSNVLAKSGHNHNYITSFGDYDTTNNKLTFNCADETSISSDALTNALAKSGHNHDKSYLKGSISYTSDNYTLNVLGTTSSLNTAINVKSHTHGTDYIKNLSLGTNSNTWTVTFGNGTTTTFTTPFLTGISVSFTNKSSSTHKHDAICTATNGTSVFYYNSASTALISTVDIYKSSDIRLKDHIRTISSSDKLESFVRFRWKESGNDSYGVIAQEVERNHPELVNTNDKGFKSVEYQGLLCNQIGKLCEDLKEKGILTDEDFV